MCREPGLELGECLFTAHRRMIYRVRDTHNASRRSGETHASQLSRGFAFRDWGVARGLRGQGGRLRSFASLNYNYQRVWT
eukprot:3318853-Prymnesium_polylepis.1